jgi:urease accessory protein
VEGGGQGVRASAHVEVERRSGRDVLVDVRSDPPMSIRRTGERVVVAGSAAGPVGGDELALDVVVGPAAHLSLGTVAATIVWPGPTGSPSRQLLRLDVGAGGHVRWEPEPLVAVARCRHSVETHVALAAGATAWLVDEVSLGRSGEPSGDVVLSWRVVRDGRPLVHHAERLGPGAPGWGSAVAAGRHRHLLATIAVGHPTPDVAPVVEPDLAMAVLAVAADAWVVLAAGASRRVVRDACTTIWAASGGQPDLHEAEVGGGVGQLDG